MWDGKVIIKKIVVVWLFKWFEVMDWFWEEFCICCEVVFFESVICKFFVIVLVWKLLNFGIFYGCVFRLFSNVFYDKLDGFVVNIVSKCNSVLIMFEV